MYGGCHCTSETKLYIKVCLIDIAKEVEKHNSNYQLVVIMCGTAFLCSFI